MTDFHATEKTLRATEKQLQKTRLAIESARAVTESHRATLTELEGRKQAEIVKAGQAGRLPTLTEINGHLEAAKAKLIEAQAVLSTLEVSEQETTRSLAVAEKAAQDALRDSWDTQADLAREQLVRVAGPLLATYFRARYHGNRPVPLPHLLRSTGEELRQDIESAAEQTDVVHDVNIPTSIESSLLTHEQRSTGLQRAAA